MEPVAPFVRVVVINFDGGQMTIDCLESLLATDYPADRLEIVMVDNGSLDDVVERVAVELPSVRVIEPLANTGFAGGCNLGIRAPGEFDLVALVNNDATVASGLAAAARRRARHRRARRRGVPEDPVRRPVPGDRRRGAGCRPDRQRRARARDPRDRCPLRRRA